MHFKTLSLRQFRNHDHLDLVLSPGLNLLVGPNGAGKSNVLEAAAIVAAGESHRGAEAKQLFSFEKDEYLLSASFDGEAPVLLETRQRRGRPRQVLLNNAPQKKMRDWVGAVPVVTFCPEDLGLVKGDPAVRRRAVNEILTQTDGAYADALQRYQKVLEERNAALKSLQEGRGARSMLEPWDLALLKEGSFLTVARARFVSRFTEIVEAHHGRLAGAPERVRWGYKPSLLVPTPLEAEELTEPEIIALNRPRLMDLRDGEIALGSTLIGPHRDDVEVLLEGRPAKAFASQGQQRTVAVAVKLAEREYLQEQTNRAPIALLDDLLSELDPARRGNLVRALAGEGQALVAMTARSDWGEALPGSAVVFQISAGRAAQETILKVESI